MPGAYTTCTAMCGNGAAIGMTSTQAQLKPTLQAQARGLAALAALTAAVAGAPARAAAGRLTATTTTQAAATTALASALFAPSK